MLHFIGKTISLIILLSLISCGNNKGSLTGEIKFSPVDIGGFLNNKKIDTFKLQAEIINKKFGYEYKSYNFYDASNTNPNGDGMFRYNDYLITGIDDKGKETVLCFFTQNSNAGTEIWNRKIIDQSKDDVLQLFGERILDETYSLKHYYAAYASGYNIVLYSEDNVSIDGVLIVKFEKNNFIRQTINLANNFNYFDGNSPN